MQMLNDTLLVVSLKTNISMSQAKQEDDGEQHNEEKKPLLAINDLVTCSDGSGHDHYVIRHIGFTA